MIDTTIEELRDNIVIDEYKLDEACRNNGQLSLIVGSRYAEVVAKRDTAKVKIEEVKAQTVRRILAEAGTQRPTVKEIESETTTDAKVMKAQEDYLAYKAEADQLKVLVDAYITRTSMLKILGDLFIHNYYSEVTCKSAEEKASTVVEKRLRDSRREKRASVV